MPCCRLAADADEEDGEDGEDSGDGDDDAENPLPPTAAAAPPTPESAALSPPRSVCATSFSSERSRETLMPPRGETRCLRRWAQTRSCRPPLLIYTAQRVKSSWAQQVWILLVDQLAPRMCLPLKY